MKLLLVEDEDRVASFLLKGFKAGGYVAERARTGREALERAAVSSFDLVVLDLDVGDLDGLELLTRFRAGAGEAPVVALSERAEVDDRVKGLDLGADDYLAKPFVFDELLAVIRARLRPRPHRSSHLLRAGDLELDLLSRLVRAGERTVRLSAREFALLEEFVRHPNQVLSREQLLSRVWNFDFDPHSNVVDVYVGYLRRKVGADRFETVHGVGYRLCAGPRWFDHGPAR